MTPLTAAKIRKGYQKEMRASIWSFVLLLAALPTNAADPVWIDQNLHHLRNDGPAEWSEFPDRAEFAKREFKFDAKPNPNEWTLRLRQQDVKQAWPVLLNGKQLGKLIQDENDQVVYLAIPAKAIVDGENQLVIEQKIGPKTTSDDIRVGEILLDHRTVEEVLQETTIDVKVIDQISREPIPSRIAILNEQGALQTTGSISNEHLAVRAGVIYTSTGDATFSLPSGKYRLIASRGFEYSIDTAEVTLSKDNDSTSTLQLVISRQVDTEGYVACDTHVHSRTHSGHGDATVIERMITLAGEGIELPIATDHNAHINHDPFAKEAKVRQYFTPVIGNEVTTKVGHFNVFPVVDGAIEPDHTLTNWNEIFDEIYQTPRVKIAILNHARDVHSGVRPFGPKLFNSAVGENLDDYAMRFNAMEIINSGATQTDPLQLTHDWMALLNRGRDVTPVGSSDSHDVARYIVGQGRTYIRCDDREAGEIDVEQAVKSFLQGQVMVSYGLATNLRVEDSHGPGELFPVSTDQIDVSVRVLGPNWVTASTVTLYANGIKIRESNISTNVENTGPSGTLWQGSWKLPRPKHDQFLVAIATGPGVESLHWKCAKPYQPTSAAWTASVLGISGAIWLDADGDNRKTSARGYAERLFQASGGDIKKVIGMLEGYDQAVACQVAHLLQENGESPLSPELRSVLREASTATQAGFRQYLEAWRQSELARASL